MRLRLTSALIAGILAAGCPKVPAPVSIPVPEPAYCATAWESAATIELVAALDAAASVGPVWDRFDLANHSVVLLGEAKPGTGLDCAALWHTGEQLELIELAEPVVLPIGLYGFYNGEPIGPEALPEFVMLGQAISSTSAEIAAALEVRSEVRATLLPVDPDLEAMGLAELLDFIPESTLMTAFGVHEGYHLHSQFPTWLDQEPAYDWPAWDRQPDRNQLVATCYESSEDVTDLHAAELADLLEAFDHTWPESSRDLDAAAEAATRFVQGRQARYELLDGQTVPTAPAAVDCSTAESIMELEEGAASFVGLTTLWRAELMTLEEVRGGFVAPLNPDFYRAGAFQLFVLEALVGEAAFVKMTSEIVTSETPSQGIHGQLKATLTSDR